MKIKQVIEKVKYKWLKETSLTIILIAIVVGIFIAINLGVRALNLKDIDLTESKLYTITEETKKQIAELPEEDKIQIYMLDYEENDSLVGFVKQYEKVNKNITVKVEKLADRLDLVSKYGIQQGYNEDGTVQNSPRILIESGEKYKLMSDTDLVTYDYNTLKSVDITEQKITNSIIAVSSKGKVVNLYIVTGHKEHTTSTTMLTLGDYLKLENYEVKEINIQEEGKVPQDCTALIIASPKQDFTDLEKEKVEEYIKSGGNILWMSDPFSATSELKNIEYILGLYGTKINQEGVMVEQDKSRIIMDMQDIILPVIEQTKVASELYDSGVVMFVDSGKLTFVENTELEKLQVTKTDILTTTDKAFFRTDLSIKEETPTDKDEEGKQIVGALLEKQVNDGKTSKLIVYANNAFSTDLPVVIKEQAVSRIRLYNNLDLILNSIAYISGIEEKIIIRKNSMDVVKYTATVAQDILVKTVVFGIPILIIASGIVVWQLRRRKR